MASDCALAVRVYCPRAQIAARRETISVARIPALTDGLVVNYHWRISPYLSVDEVHEHVDELDRKMRAAFTGIVRIVGHAEPLRA